MKHIIKNNSPQTFEDWKKEEERCWNDLEKLENHFLKKELKRSLLDEQGYICCYCGQQVEESSNSVIEHFLNKDDNPNFVSEYKNVFTSCKGGQDERIGKIRKEKRLIPLFCDAYKKKKYLEISPLDSDCEEKFLYGQNGEIWGKDENSKDTVRKLNLDNSVLKNMRKAAIEPFVQEIPTVEEIKMFINAYSNKNNGKFEPFCNAIVGFLKTFI